MIIYLNQGMSIASISLMVTLLLIQAFGLFFMFRFVRKPWQGKIQKDEEVDQIEKDRMFESISSFQNDFTQRDYDGTMLGNRLQEKFTAN